MPRPKKPKPDEVNPPEPARKEAVPYSEEIADQICDKLMEPMMLAEICRLPGFPTRQVVHRWLNSKPDFQKKFEIAKQLQADALVEEIFSIADDSIDDTYCDEHGNTKPNFERIQRSRLRVDVRKWYACKIKPKLYGEKPVQFEFSGGEIEKSPFLKALNSKAKEVWDGDSSIQPETT
jgi:hypothetical protein